MNEQEVNDLLIRLDERSEDIVARIEKIEKKLDIPLKCQANTEKIKTLQFLSYTALAGAITATIRAFWSSITS